MDDRNPSARGPGPCLRHGCHACCIDTNMTLTLADVARLERAGFGDFVRPGRSGQLHLRRVGGVCVFLRDGRCLAYTQRPEGCALYPLVLDVARDAVVLDDFCPHRREFCFTVEDRARLRRSVADEEREAATRQRVV